MHNVHFPGLLVSCHLWGEQFIQYLALSQCLTEETATRSATANASLTTMDISGIMDRYKW